MIDRTHALPVWRQAEVPRPSRGNVFIERLWRSVKYEEVHLWVYDSVGHARGSLACYLDFYNAKRLHSSLDARTPDQADFAIEPLARAA